MILFSSFAHRRGAGRLSAISFFAVSLSALSCFVGTPAHAQLSAFSDAADGELLPTGASNNTTANVARVGTGHVSGPSGGRDGVFPFQLPTLSAGQQIATASLAFALDTFSSSGQFAYNVDLYGAGVYSTSAITNVGFFTGASDTSPTLTLIQDNFATPSSGLFTASGSISTSTAAKATLLNYLNGLYTAGATGGQYVFFRLTPDYVTDPAPTTSTGYNFRTVEIGAGNGRPTLTYTLGSTATPEPAPVALIASASLIVLPHLPRRRR